MYKITVNLTQLITLIIRIFSLRTLGLGVPLLPAKSALPGRPRPISRFRSTPAAAARTSPTRSAPIGRSSRRTTSPRKAAPIRRRRWPFLTPTVPSSRSTSPTASSRCTRRWLIRPLEKLTLLVLGLGTGVERAALVGTVLPHGERFGGQVAPTEHLVVAAASWRATGGWRWWWITVPRVGGCGGAGVEGYVAAAPATAAACGGGCVVGATGGDGASAATAAIVVIVVVV